MFCAEWLSGGVHDCAAIHKAHPACFSVVLMEICCYRLGCTKSAGAVACGIEDDGLNLAGVGNVVALKSESAK